jgi:hypothetical protein
MSERDEDLTQEEAKALRSLAASGEPPEALERATVERLRARGLIGVSRRPWLSWLLAAAAGVALFAAGIAVGRRPPAPPSGEAMPRFALFLYDAPSEASLTEAQMRERVSEYRSWAMRLRESGGEIRGEKLGPESRRLGAAAPSGAPLGGYFIVSARDWDAAMAVARSCPHLRHGGTIEVRQIEKT